MAELTYAPRVEQRALWNDNRLLIPDPPESVLGETTDVRLGLELSDELWRLQATPRTRISRYTGDQDYDTTEYFLVSEFQRDFEFGQLTQTFDVDRTSTLTSELLDAANRVVANRNRYEIDLGTAYTHFLSERNSLTANFGFNSVNFEDALQSGFSDYRYFVGALTYAHQFSENTQWFVSAGRNFFKSITVPSTSTTNVFYVGLAHVFDETLNSTLSVGQILGTVERPLAGATLSDSGAGLYLNFAFDKTYKNWYLDGSFVRQVQPSSIGAQRTSDNATGRLIYRWGQDWNFLARVNRGVDTAQSDDVSGISQNRLNRKFMIANARLAYSLDDKWQLVGEYQLRRQQRPTAGIRSKGNIVGFAIIYGPDAALANEIWF